MSEDNRSVAEIIGAANEPGWWHRPPGVLVDNSASYTHEDVALAIACICEAPETPEQLIRVKVDDPQDVVAQWVRQRAGRPLGLQPTWLRFIHTGRDRGAVFVISAPHPCGEADLVVVSEPGVLCRSVFRDVCRWAFWGQGLWRLVARIPADRPDLQDYARRAGFKFEGTARRFFGGIVDAQTWAMAGPDCRWLPQNPPAISAVDISPKSSGQVH